MSSRWRLSGLPRHAWWLELTRGLSRALWPRLPARGRRWRRSRWRATPIPATSGGRVRADPLREGRSGGNGSDGAASRFSARRPTATRWDRVPRRPPRWYRLLRGIIALALVGGVLFAIVDWRLRPTLHQIAEAQARVLATEAVTQAVAHEIAEDIRWEDLYALRPDSAGRVVLVQPNTAEIDRLTSKVTLRIQELLKRTTSTRIRIPLGQVLGSQILANVGPRISISVVPIGTVTTRISSDFEQAGINQIRHKIYLEVAAQVKLVVPLVASTVDVMIQVPITEVLIMGDVPETYIQLEGSELRNLITPQSPPGQ